MLNVSPTYVFTYITIPQNEILSIMKKKTSLFVVTISINIYSADIFFLHKTILCFLPPNDFAFHSPDDQNLSLALSSPLLTFLHSGLWRQVINTESCMSSGRPLFRSVVESKTCMVSCLQAHVVGQVRLKNPWKMGAPYFERPRFCSRRTANG
jgi:hypothetical protein